MFVFLCGVVTALGVNQRPLRGRVLPVYVSPSRPDTPTPIPGSPQKLRYTLRAPAELALVKDAARSGAFVHVFQRAQPGAVGCVVEVQMANVADDVGVIVGTCADPDARVRLDGVVKEFPYVAARLALALDETTLTEEDPLSAYDVVEDDDLGDTDTVDRMRNGCVKALDDALQLAQRLEPNLGADAIGAPGEFCRMRKRLAELAEEDDDERGHRALSFSLLSMAGAPRDLVEKCLLSTSVARRYAAITRHLNPIVAELAAVQALSDNRPDGPPRPAPRNAPLALALLRPGRRLLYWWDHDTWVKAVVVEGDPESPANFLLDFDGGKGRLSLPLAGVDRSRWKLLPFL